ncbi:MAG: hypothetical protein HC896_16260 [Bacteroidales bacterium]|nr:hypothetical protein [Bacteroidales bacterium]
MRKLTFLFLSVLLSLMVSRGQPHYISFYDYDFYGGCDSTIGFTNTSYIDTVQYNGPVTYSWFVNGYYEGSGDSLMLTLPPGNAHVELHAGGDFGPLGMYSMDYQIGGSPRDFYMSSGPTACPGEAIDFDGEQQRGRF